ncbi:hypothetical protein CDL12_01176 [Handroanthus impetiginosus]|uniref:Uncharacterized protein n=1 Tax=Handroanthus impetiginosus TaxID=429701 RepID=A0A2G9I8K0_9LAMI|nr:hypothetical protein CDL12_01176 [Handroanthus impetiginosus]
MGSMLGGFVLPLLLLTGFRLRGRVLSLWFVFIYSAFVILLQVIFLTLSATRDSQWSIADAWWIKLLGLMKINSWRSPKVIYFLVVEFLVGLVALIEINRSKFGFVEFQGSFWGVEDSCWGYLSSIVNEIGMSKSTLTHIDFY